MVNSSVGSMTQLVERKSVYYTMVSGKEGRWASYDNIPFIINVVLFLDTEVDWLLSLFFILVFVLLVGTFLIVCVEPLFLQSFLSQ